MKAAARVHRPTVTYAPPIVWIRPAMPIIDINVILAKLGFTTAEKNWSNLLTVAHLFEIDTWDFRVWTRSRHLRCRLREPDFSALLFCYLPEAGSFSAAVSTGILRKRLPVAAKIALPTAGTIAEVPHSPIPPGGSEF